MEQRTLIPETKGPDDLRSVLGLARHHGVAELADLPLAQLFEEPELGGGGRALLERLHELGPLPRVGALVSDPRVVAFLEKRAKPYERRALGLTLITVLMRMRDERLPVIPLADAEGFAAEHGVSARLAAPLRVLHELVESRDRSHLYSGGQVVRDVFVGGTRSKSPWPRDALPRLQGAAKRFLEGEAALRKEALAEEAERLARPLPAGPAARALAERLLAARARVRPGVEPRGRRSLPPRLKSELQVDPPALVVTEEEWPHRTTTRLPLIPARAPIVPACSCATEVLDFSSEKPASCVHVLGVIDALLDRLVDPRARETMAALLAEIDRPSWSLALADLDAQLAPAPSPPGEPVAISWRIGRSDGALTLTPALQRASSSKGRGAGGRTRGTQARARDLIEAMPPGASAADREAVLLLTAAEHLFSAHAGAVTARAVQALVGQPGVSLASAPQTAVEVRAGTLELAAVDQPDGGVVLEPRLDGEPIAPALLAGSINPRDALSVIIDEPRRRCTVVQIGESLRRVLAVLVKRGGKFPAEALPALGERLPALIERASLAVPASLSGEPVETDPRLVVRFEPTPGEDEIDVRVLVRPLAGAGAFVAGQGPPTVMGVRDGRRVHVARELAAEPARVRQAIAELPLTAEREPFVFHVGRGEPALDLLGALQDAAGIVVEWEAAPRVTRVATSADLRVRVEDKRDWFGLAGGIDVDGVTVPLAKVLAALRARRRWVEVAGGLWVRLGNELRERLAPAGDLVGRGQGDGLEVPAFAAPVLADLVGKGIDDADLPRRFRSLVARIRAADERVAEPPAELAPVLRDYQLIGFRWLARLAGWGAGACLADDMGLGKTLQALALLGERAQLGPALVVAPTSVAWNWIREAQRFMPGMRTILYGEGDRAEARARLAPGDVLVITYGLLARDVDELAKTRFATFVLDEAQAIKNPATQRARAAGMIVADVRVALTGTPVENLLAELWSLFRVIVPGLLGSWERFRERFAVPIEKDDDSEARAALARLVRPFILRRLKAEVAPELPARTEIREEVTLSPAERARYEEVRRAVLAELANPARSVEAGEQQQRFQVLAAMTRLRQLACHPRLVDPKSEIPSAKLERCLELIDELREGGHRALVFSQFTAHLALLRAALDAAEVPYLYLDGQTPAGKRKQLVDAFQAGEGDLFLISLKAGGTGLNLTGADYVIHLDPWWNPAVEDQATDRAHRIGQQRPVTVYRLVARATIEEAILDLHGDKRRLVAGILDGTGSAAAIGTEELMELLKV